MKYTEKQWQELADKVALLEQLTADIEKAKVDIRQMTKAEIINKYGKAIILEDDIITGKYFLEYMNEALEKYQGNKEVWHVTGWRDPIKHTKKISSKSQTVIYKMKVYNFDKTKSKIINVKVVCKA